MVQFLEIISYVVPVLSIFLSYFLGSLTSRHSIKREVFLKRYESFYVPFMNTLLADYDFTDCPSESPIETRSIYLDLAMKNTQYLGKKSALLIPTYYKAFIDLLECENGNADYLDADKDYDEIYLKFCKTILLEAKGLAKYLKYPELASTILEIYDL